MIILSQQKHMFPRDFYKLRLMMKGDKCHQMWLWIPQEREEDDYDEGEEKGEAGSLSVEGQSSLGEGVNEWKKWQRDTSPSLLHLLHPSCLLFFLPRLIALKTDKIFLLLLRLQNSSKESFWCKRPNTSGHKNLEVVWEVNQGEKERERHLQSLISYVVEVLLVLTLQASPTIFCYI